MLFSSQSPNINFKLSRLNVDLVLDICSPPEISDFVCMSSNYFPATGTNDFRIETARLLKFFRDKGAPKFIHMSLGHLLFERKLKEPVETVSIN